MIPKTEELTSKVASATSSACPSITRASLAAKGCSRSRRRATMPREMSAASTRAPASAAASASAPVPAAT
jgi:hypothetical protein